MDWVEAIDVENGVEELAALLADGGSWLAKGEAERYAT